jgi:hypothetical protein
MAKLLISQKAPNTLRLRLLRGKKILDTVDFGFDKNLDTVLLVSIDNLLKRNKIDIPSLKTIEVASDIDKNSSLYKIVKTWIAAVNTIKKSL